jgi:hypothetical protein
MAKLSKSCRVKLLGTRLARDIRGGEKRHLSFAAEPCEPFGADQPTAQIELFVEPFWAAQFEIGEVYFLSLRQDETPES